MSRVVITQDRSDIGKAIERALQLIDVEPLGLGQGDTAKMEFPAMELKEAIQAFTEAAYGERLTFEHK